ncbi:uncharacterized protein BX664DRAFT_161293 [Halteromyces radiatus]|uniref:uncharacterized protein n=1 Tax=Halteromyces radiatus TaxID=101107 RepID=UPI00221E94F0|nr:uncharacterized protein BX664DRAFT_161293 [Halteromyces radiatus]KAI8086604.1 hypothetical protein BX664DRAFT_161293 [Halteromyces radiatus]
MSCQRPVSFPISLSSSSSSISRTTGPLSGARWRKHLIRLSKKWIPPSSKHYSRSGTVAAAATEKFIRRPQATVQTEDLTASQFAFMAGIKIKRGRNHQDKIDDYSDFKLSNINMTNDDIHYEESDDDTDDDDDDDDGMQPLTLDDSQLRHLTTKVTNSQHGSVPCMTSYSSTRCPIWDSRFWQRENQQKQKQHQKKKDIYEKPPSTTDKCSDVSTNDTLSSSASTLNTCHSNNLPTKPRVILKGRFKIVMGDSKDEQLASEPLVRTISTESSNVVEWRRKRTATQ